MKLNALKFGLATGIVWGLNLFILTFAYLYLDGYAGEWLNMTRDFFPGYDLTIQGSFVGLFYGFVTGFISGTILAWLYNRLLGV